MGKLLFEKGQVVVCHKSKDADKHQKGKHFLVVEDFEISGKGDLTILNEDGCESKVNPADFCSLKEWSYRDRGITFEFVDGRYRMMCQPNGDFEDGDIKGELQTSLFGSPIVSFENKETGQIKKVHFTWDFLVRKAIEAVKDLEG